jgi:hypothetical protein
VSRQVALLLQENDALRTSSLSASQRVSAPQTPSVTLMSLVSVVFFFYQHMLLWQAAGQTALQVIEANLVNITSIEEMQQQNVQLRHLVKELSEQHEVLRTRI